MFREIQRQSTSFAYRMSSDHEEWRGARDFDYDDGRPSRIDLAQEQAEDEFWEEKERDYPRGYGPPQTGDEDHDHPGWLYVDDEAPIPDEVTDADLVEDDDFDPYEDEIGDGPLPFDTPIYHPGGGYDDYDKRLNLIEEQEGSGPDIEKFSATEDFDCDGIHNWGPNERCEDCGKEDTREPGDEKPIGKLPKREGRNPFDRREGMARRVGPGRYEHDSPYGTFGIYNGPRDASSGYGTGPAWDVHTPSWDGQPDPHPSDTHYSKADALRSVLYMIEHPEAYGLKVPNPEDVEYSKSLQARKIKGGNPFDRRVAWGDRTHPPAPQKKTKEPEVAVRNDDVKIMRDSETGLGYDAIVKVNDKGGYDVIKILGRQRHSALPWEKDYGGHFRSDGQHHSYSISNNEGRGWLLTVMDKASGMPIARHRERSRQQAQAIADAHEAAPLEGQRQLRMQFRE